MSNTDRHAGAHPLKDKVVLVTGGSRGIGAAMAKRFAAVGSQVAVGCRSQSPAVERVLGEIAAQGAQAIAVYGDIAKPDEARNIVAETVKRFGRLDVVVNCAGISNHRPFAESDPAFFRAIFDTNVLGTIEVIQAALPHLPSPGGRIINFSSALATRPLPRTAIYAASKAAVSALSHALAKEFGPRGITVNAIAPGVIETDMTQKALAERGDTILAQTPLARIGQPDDVAGVALFLASPDSGWVTGRTFIVDGGVS